MTRHSGLIMLRLPLALILGACTAGDPSFGTPSETESFGTGERSLAITEAPTSFELVSNGVATDEEFLEALEAFAEREELDEGLGPLHNQRGCGDCHDNPEIGGTSQISELRAGHFTGTVFIPQGDGLINEQAINADIQERLLAGQEVRTFRMSLNLFGDGFVEAIDSNTLREIANAQPAGQRGLVIQVPVLEADGALRVGRFGWKNQHASLISFSADAYKNEMGITSPLEPEENTRNGVSVAEFDEVPDPEDDGADIELFALFTRSLAAPPRDPVVAATASAQRGSQLFDTVGCAVCHVRNIDTAAPGDVINGGAFEVPDELGDKRIHPFGDFLLHNVGTGDGIVQNGGNATRLRLRTPPLWGMRARTRLMHDGANVSRTDAILRHGGEARAARDNFASLSAGSQNDIVNFLASL